MELRDREVAQEGGGRGSIASRVDLHDLRAGLSLDEDGVVELEKKGCAGGLGVFRGGELKGAGIGWDSLGTIVGAGLRYLVVVNGYYDVAVI